jgi:DNA-binding XRE family transcriptional regulator
MEEYTQLRKDVKDEFWSALLREFRREQGLSRREAAKRAGLSWRTWEGWELGRSNPAGLYRERLEKILKR